MIKDMEIDKATEEEQEKKKKKRRRRKKPEIVNSNFDDLAGLDGES